MSTRRCPHLITVGIGFVCFAVCCSARRRAMSDNNQLPPGCVGLGSAADCKARCGEQNYAWRCNEGRGECKCQNPDAMPGNDRSNNGRGVDQRSRYSGPTCTPTSADCQARCGGGQFRWHCDMGVTTCECPKPSRHRGYDDGPGLNDNERQQNLPDGYGDCSHKQDCESICGEYKHYKCNASYGETCECMYGSPNAGTLKKYW